MNLELALWREVGRHLEIQEALQRMAPALAKHLGVERALIRRVDFRRGLLETVAAEGTGEGATPPSTSTPLAPAEGDRLAAWFGAPSVLRGERGRGDPLLALLLPPGFPGEVLAGPLAGDDGPAGVVILAPPPGRPFPPGAEARLSALLEPLALALAHDRRLHELARLREKVEADNRALLSRLQMSDISASVVGAETGLREVMDRVEQVAPTDAPVLILGETGSGKEVVARAVHTRSRRAAGPFLRVNCGAIPAELVDSELFGHERGSFTGAVEARRGWFERADGGTLFLDEVAELPAAAQVRLLRVLQDGSYERVGGQRTLSSSVRVVAATHRDMEALMRAGRFREDLWYRLSVFPIGLPPLRERLGDLPALASHFAARASLRLHGTAIVPSAGDLDLLRTYAWPGNIRELSSVMERAVILGNGKSIEVAAAMGGVRGAVAGEPARGGAAPGAAPGSLDAAVRARIEQALTVSRGRVEGPFGAAKALAVNPHTLRARMRKLRLDWRSFRI